MTHKTSVIQRISATKITAGAVAVLASITLSALAGSDNRAPEVPAEIAVDSSTNKVQVQALGIGFQVYTWDGSTWTGPVPDATLFDSEGNFVASHFEGPSWQSSSGSKVVGGVTGKITVDETAIPWVRLVPLSRQGPGVFADVTFIQRINTVGGKAPATNGTVVGQIAKSPYTANYIFYRAANE
jgi:hypothetical protein